MNTFPAPSCSVRACDEPRRRGFQPRCGPSARPCQSTDSVLARKSLGGWKPPLLARCVLFLALALVANDLTVFAAPRITSPNPPLDCPPDIKIHRPGVKLTLVAEHPQVATPIGIGVDKQGRVWVVNSHTHMRPDDYPGPQHDEIVVLSKPGADGRMQERSVFYNKTTATMGLLLGADGWVYLSERGRLLRVKDTDGDGIGDREETIATLNTEEKYPHNGMSGLAWHRPSGDLIFGLGENMGKEWTLTGSDGAAIRGSGEGGIFRCKPDGSQLRRIAKGFWNPFGVCADYGIFAVDNDPGSRPPCRLLHIMEGGDYGYQRAYGDAPFHPFVAWNGELRGTLPMMGQTGEAPCGLAGLDYGFLVPSWADNRIDYFRLSPRGASYAAYRTELIRGGEMFRPTCIASPNLPKRTPVTPAPSEYTYYIADWVYGSYPLHQRGRVWKLEIFVGGALRDWLEPEAPRWPLEAQQFEQLVDPARKHRPQELFAMARSKDAFVARAALLALSRQPEKWSDPRSIAKLPARDRVSACLALGIAKPADEKAARAFLADKDAEVQFEALRWISNERLATLRPEVEQLLAHPDLDYHRFEACLATLNTLAGNARAGVNDKAMLLARVLDIAAPPHVRAFALRLLPPNTMQLTVPVLNAMLGLKSDLLSLEAVRTLARKSDKDASSILASIACHEFDTAELRAEAILGLASAPEEYLPLLMGLAHDSNSTIRNEALRAMRFAALADEQKTKLGEVAKRHPDSADLVRGVLKPGALADGRPFFDLPAWQKYLGKQKSAGDAAAGRRIFFHPKIALCSNCHMHSGRGNVVGPDLSAVGDRNDAAWLLLSILEPNREVAPQFFATNVLFKDGTSFLGIKLRKGGGASEVYRDLTGNERTIKTADIARRSDLTTSLMPAGLLATLTDREIRDLLAFLSQRSESRKSP